MRIAILIFLFLTVVPVYADSVQESGFVVDWEQMRLSISGSSQVVPQDSGNVIDWQLKASRKAEENLLRNFIDAMKSIQVDGYRTAHDVLYNDLERNEQIYQFYHKIKAHSISYDETTVVVEKVLDFYGSDGFMPILFQSGKETGNFPEYCDYVFSTVFTGLVVDARGLERRPALAPRIFDQGHNLVYSANLMERYHFVQRGAVLYVTDPNDNRIEGRVGENPFRTIAIPDNKLLETDISMFSEDARILLHHQATINNLQMGRVVVIIDSIE